MKAVINYGGNYNYRDAKEILSYSGKDEEMEGEPENCLCVYVIRSLELELEFELEHGYRKKHLDEIYLSD